MRNKSILFGKPQSTLTSMVCLLVNGFIDQLLIARRQNRHLRKFSTKIFITTSIISSRNSMRRIGSPEIISDNAESWRRKGMLRLVMEAGMFLEITNCKGERSRQLRWYWWLSSYLSIMGLSLVVICMAESNWQVSLTVHMHSDQFNQGAALLQSAVKAALTDCPSPLLLIKFTLIPSAQFWRPSPYDRAYISILGSRS